MLLPLKTIADKFQVHYYFDDDSHTIDAIFRNRCETELLHLMRDISISLDLELDILTEPSAEGGFIDAWKLLEKNKEQLQIISPYAVMILMYLFNYLPKNKTELEKLQIESTKLDIEEKKLRIEETRKKITSNEFDSSEMSNYFDTDFKLLKHRSNFFKLLRKYSKVESISVSSIVNNSTIVETTKIGRETFESYIIENDDLPPLKLKNIIVEVVSPVLKNAKYKWKGIYEGEIIDFTMSDKAFKKRVLNKLESFESGCFIMCNMEIKRKLNEIGEIQNVSYNVKAVTGRIVDDEVIETEIGKRMKFLEKAQKTSNNQTKLF